ncbi:hydroxyacid dehydrogenase [Candidimonas humi]|uniref:Hydroxyacid dehydrogenase n=1 Tax=Candidimonas humi TaxID=683355 RepID=A0ABV8P3L7_9BURK|nr:hydroxyacid dehydrogenase [Candidimonas humi]MBV6306877.1 hydroxyacid dehydrogenase [Candidimonas humi]
MKLVISEFMDEAAVDKLAQVFDTTYDPALVDDRPALLAALAQADALIVRNRSRVDAALLQAAPGLRVVGRLGVGLDNIDVPACAGRGIEVIPATGANAQAVAEYVIGTAMALLRGYWAGNAATAAGEWPRAALSQGREISGKCLGLVGFGGIGRLTAGLAQGLGMQVVAHDPMLAPDAAAWGQAGVGPARLDEVLAQADVVSLHVPLTEQTRGLIGREALSRMRQTAILINTSRGGIVDEAALGAALKAGRLAGAAIDVYAQEPLPGGGPLADAPNILLTPHIAGVTAESNVRVSSLIADRVIEFMSAPR